MPKYDLPINSPLMNAAGSLGFAPARRTPVDLSSFGAFITNPISREERSPAGGTRFLTFSGGFLVHTGYPNPGLKRVIRRYGGHWRASDLPVIVHLIGDNPADIADMVARLESTEGVQGIELGIPPKADMPSMLSLVESALGELPLIVRLPFERAVELSRALVALAISAVSVSPPRGLLPGPNRERVTGRLYGPAVFPFAFAAVQAMAASGIAVIGSGGIYTQEQAEALLAAGAVGAQLDAVLWRGWPA